MIGKNISRIRKLRGWTQQKLSEKTRLSYSVVTKVEQSVIKDPGIKTLIKMADALSVSVDQLVGRSFPKKK